jgi:hypothetical protein
VGVAVAEGEGDAVGLGVGDALGVSDGIGVALGVGVCDGFGVGVAVGVDSPNWLRAFHTAFCQLPSDPAPGVSQSRFSE